MRKWIALALSSGCLCVMYGCSMQTAACIVGSSLPITSADTYTVVGEASGKSTALGVMGIQLWPNSAYSALQRAKRKAGADGLINISADNKITFIPPIFSILTIHTMEMRGQAIRFERGAGS